MKGIPIKDHFLSSSMAKKPTTAVAYMSKEEKVEEAIRRALPLLPPGIRDQVAAMLTKESIAIMVGVLVLWATSHFFGVGVIADIILLIVGFAAVGGVAVQIGQDLINFGNLAINATSEPQLDKAAKHFASAVSLGGVTVIMALLLKKHPKRHTFKRDFINPKDLKGMSSLYMPPTNGKMFYKPKVIKERTLAPGFSQVTQFGDIYVSTQGSARQLAYTLFHEKIHSILSPKFFMFRKIRAELAMNAYSKSYILRTIEEALAETYALLRVEGINKNSFIQGLHFPLNHGYATVAQNVKEARGILLGPINVGGMIYQVFYSYNAPYCS